MQDRVDKAWIQKFSLLMQGLQAYHDYTVVGLEHIPKKGPAIVAVNHSLATYDILLLVWSIYQKTGRLPRMLGDRLIFKIPYFRDWAEKGGVFEGTKENAQQLLKQGELILIAPGGMREALRSSKERYRIDWQKRRGFVRLAMHMQAPIILAACAKADDLFTVYAHPLTHLVYQKFKIPLPFFLGRKKTIVPHPEALTHKIAEPLLPPSTINAKTVKQFHFKVIRKMQQLMKQSLTEKR